MFFTSTHLKGLVNSQSKKHYFTRGIHCKNHKTHHSHCHHNLSHFSCTLPYSNVDVTCHVLSAPHPQDVLNHESREVQSYKEVEGVGGASAEHHLEGPHTALSIGKHRTRGLKRTQAHLRRFGGVWTAVVASDDRSVHRGASKSRLDGAEKLH